MDAHNYVCSCNVTISGPEVTLGHLGPVCSQKRKLRPRDALSELPSVTRWVWPEWGLDPVLCSPFRALWHILSCERWKRDRRKLENSKGEFWIWEFLVSLQSNTYDNVRKISPGLADYKPRVVKNIERLKLNLISIAMASKAYGFDKENIVFSTKRLQHKVCVYIHILLMHVLRVL